MVGNGIACSRIHGKVARPHSSFQDGAKNMFVDRAEIYVRGGDGGDGAISFRREKYIPRGGPDGGDGGHGGNVVIWANPDANNLSDLSFRRHWKADSGKPGMGKNKTGKSAEDLVISAPPGTIVKDREHGFVIKDLAEPNSRVIIVRGGKGGRGNTRFTTSTNQAPRESEPGQPGEERWIILELKMIADVGIIGLPNAGKSTLLSRLSHARPEIADYPFTTKYPNLGLLRIDYDRSCVLADIPGLIEGAHAGVGLGHEFLRHVERTRVLIHLVECEPSDGSDPLHNYNVVRKELELYSPQLAKKPEIVALSKVELTDCAELVERLRSTLGRPILPLSAVTGAGLKELTLAITQQLYPAP